LIDGLPSIRRSHHSSIREPPYKIWRIKGISKTGTKKVKLKYEPKEGRHDPVMNVVRHA
jgi:hypothetical protein